MAVCLLLILLASLTSVVQAQSNAPQQFLFDGRALWSSIFQSKLEQDLISGSRVTVKFDDDLGITSVWGSQVRAIWKITAGNRIRFDYRRLEHSGEKVVEKDILIDDIIFRPVAEWVPQWGEMNSDFPMPIFFPLEVNAFG